MLHLLINLELKPDQKLLNETQKIEIGLFLQSLVKYTSYTTVQLSMQVGKLFLAML